MPKTTRTTATTRATRSRRRTTRVPGSEPVHLCWPPPKMRILAPPSVRMAGSVESPAGMGPGGALVCVVAVGCAWWRGYSSLISLMAARAAAASTWELRAA